jgi:oligosaccharyltransferase complex subunit delta (ribophorin II)
VPKKDAKGHFLAKTNLGTTEFLESLFGAGEYDISVIVGDALLVKPAKWTAGTIVLSLPKDKEADPHTDLFAVKPDIKHAFRAAETRPSALMATLFTGLAAAPFVVLLLSLMASGLSVQFPADAQEFLANVLFQGSIGAILLLYIAYWLFLNIFQALGMLAILSVVAVATGNRALKRRNQRNAAAAAARAEAGATAAASGAGAAGSHSHSD